MAATGVKLSKTKNHMKIGQALVLGTTATTDITVTGIKSTDEILSVIEIGTGGATHNWLTAYSITADDTIQCTSATDGDKLLVTWCSAN